MMSCLNLRRLLPSKKIWKLFTNKLQQKLKTSKAIKKPKKDSKKLRWPSLSIQPKKFKSKPKLRASILHHQNHHYCIKKRSAPVYVDQLFIEPVSVVKEHVHIPEHKNEKGKVCSSRRSVVLNQSNCSQSETSYKIEKTVSNDDEHKKKTADDMWESLILDSPHEMRDIDERAEEFIASFRAEMRHQEMLVRRL